jgi:hypothetical protein
VEEADKPVHVLPVKQLEELHCNRRLLSDHGLGSIPSLRRTHRSTRSAASSRVRHHQPAPPKSSRPARAANVGLHDAITTGRHRRAALRQSRSPLAGLMSKHANAAVLARIATAIPPASGAMVLATMSLSLAFSFDGLKAISRVLLVLGAVAWIALGLLLAARTLRERDRVKSEARSPAALTGVAGTALLGARLTLVGWTTAGIALLIVALGFWVVLLRSVLDHWVTPTVGGSLALAVSTEALAVLCAVLGVREGASWLLGAAIAPFLLGLGFYVFVMARFDLGQISLGQGDHWITAGAVALAATAAARITIGANHLHSLTAVTGVLKTVSLALWLLILVWLPILVVAEVVRPRLHYDARRWSTVFPVGTHAACSFGVGAAVGAGAITTFGRVWVWVGLAVWLLVFVAMVRTGAALARGSVAAARPSQ